MIGPKIEGVSGFGSSMRTDARGTGLVGSSTLKISNPPGPPAQDSFECTSISPEFIDVARTSLERLPTGEAMKPALLTLFLLCTSQMKIPPPSSPPQGPLKVPV